MAASTPRINELPEIRSGLRLLDRYELETPLARGGMGMVWKAKHLHLGSAVAVKFALMPSAETPERLFFEARTGAALGSPHIVQILDVGETAHIPFLVMELLNGEPLDERLRATGKLSVSETLSLVNDVARGLSVAHAAGVIHRDLKPSNIFLVENSGEILGKILDFGIAHTKESTLTASGELVGTPRFMSPEVCLPGATIDARVDLWALALVIYECLTGIPPHHGKTATQILRSLGDAPLPAPSAAGFVSVKADAWFCRATHPCLEERFQDVETLVRELREALESDTLGSVASVNEAALLADSTAPTLQPHEKEPASSERDLVSAIEISRMRGRAGFALGVALATILLVFAMFLSFRSPVERSATTASKSGTDSPLPESTSARRDFYPLEMDKPLLDVPATPQSTVAPKASGPPQPVRIAPTSKSRMTSADSLPQTHNYKDESPSVWDRRK